MTALRTATAARLSFYLFIAGGIAGLIQLNSPVGFGAGYEMFSEAKNMAAHREFANPFDTSYRPHCNKSTALPPGTGSPDEAVGRA